MAKRAHGLRSGGRWLARAHSIALLLSVAPFLSAQTKAEENLADRSLEELMNVKVVSAALHQQDLADAPGDITVVTAAEIRQWGSRTLAEALRYVRGIYISNDGTGSFPGIRGFSLPGDFLSRIVLMINGHTAQGNIFSSSPDDNDLPVDMDLVERIEILRGASSALYGSNGVLATINIITRKPNEQTGAEVRLQTGGEGQRKLFFSDSVQLSHGVSLLFSGSVYNNLGARQIFFPELNTPDNNFGRSVDTAGDKGYHSFAQLMWGHWSLMATAGSDVKGQPISYIGTVFNDRGERSNTAWSIFNLAYAKELSHDRTVYWEGSYNSDLFRGFYHYPDPGGVIDNRERDSGQWLATKGSYRFRDGGSGHLTVGGEFRFDLEAAEHVFNLKPSFLEVTRLNERDRYVGIFGQQEWSLGNHWQINAGARFDESWLKQSSISPRVAAIYRPTDRSVLKLIYGRGFRNPTNYEKFYEDNGESAVANLALRPETTDTFEIVAEHQISHRFQGTLGLYEYRIHGLIQQMFLPSGLAQFQNLSSVNAKGVSAGLVYRLPADLQLTTSLELQQARTQNGSVLPNSPGQTGKLQLSSPLFRNNLNIGLGIRAVGERRNPAFNTISPSVLPEVVLSSRVFPSGVQFTAGIRNFTNSSYRDPIGITPTVNSIPRNERTFYLNIGWQSARDSEAAVRASRTP